MHQFLHRMLTMSLGWLVIRLKSLVSLIDTHRPVTVFSGELGISTLLLDKLGNAKELIHFLKRQA
jgi:hypothetical protein